MNAGRREGLKSPPGVELNKETPDQENRISERDGDLSFQLAQSSWLESTSREEGSP